MKKAAKEPCDLCDGELQPRRVRVVRSRSRKLVIIDNVPAMVCNQCGTKYFEASAVRSMEALLRRNRAHARTIKVPITKFEVVA